MRRIVDEGGSERILRGHREHTPPPIFPCERRRASETRGRRLAFLLRQVTEQLACCITPSTSYFAREDEELAHFGPQQFGILPAFRFLNVGNGHAAGGDRCTWPWLPIGLDR